MNRTDRLCLWVAQGFGVGRLRPGPGTWGSVVGLALTLLLLLPGHPAFYLGLNILLIAVAIPICTRAEKCLGQPDPGSIVLDEIVAVPIAFSGYALHWWLVGASPMISQIRQWWPALIVAFVLFRIFDIWKPWPIRRLQAFHGGLGIVVDDVAAALVSALVLGIGTRAAFYIQLAIG
jgi:phosphatidylglycerophosphatase A